MKRSMFRLLTISLSVIAIMLFAGSVFAQGNGNGGGKGGGKGGGGGDDPPQVGVGYSVCWPTIPGNTQDVYVLDFAMDLDGGNPIDALVVGAYRTSNSQFTAFVYDHFGFIDRLQSGKFWNFHELVPSLPSWVPPTHTESVFYSVNASGRIAGVFRDPNNGRDKIAFYIELADRSLHEIPVPPFAAASDNIGFKSKVNEAGDILVPHYPLVGNDRAAFIYNPGALANDPSDDEYLEILDVDGTPLDVGGDIGIYFNSLRIVVAERHDLTVVRFPAGGAPNEYDEFLSMDNISGINEFSEFSGTAHVPIRRNRVERRATKISQDGSLQWQTSETAWTADINNSGDIVGQETSSTDYYLHEGNPTNSGDELFLDLDTLVIEESDPNRLLRDSGWDDLRVSDRDSTDFGWIAGRAVTGTNPDGSYHGVLFLLLPEILP